MIRLDARKPLAAGAPAVPPLDEGGVDFGALVQLGTWGGAAAACLLMVAIATRTETGQARLAEAYASLTGQSETDDLQSAERQRRREEARQTSETLRSLDRDRDRLLVRVTALERNYEDVTGSISKLARAAKAAAAPPSAAVEAGVSPVASAAPATTASGAPATNAPAAGATPAKPDAAPVASVPGTVPIPSPPPAPPAAKQVADAPVVTGSTQPAASKAAASAPTAAAPSAAEPQEPESGKGEFGVDVGGAPTLAAIRTAWDRIRKSQARLLDGLRPVIAVRESRGGQMELRLIVGPIGNPADAAKLCASLARAGLSCQPTQFEGQRLAQR
jgi:hypothetical protein